MPLDPQVENLLAEAAKAQLPPVNEMSIEQARRQMLAVSATLGPPEPVAAVEDRIVPGPDGDLPIRIYRPSTGEPLPVVVYFHGGGWVMGSIESHDGYCRSLANAAKAIVVSVEYRLAPEHTFPSASEDAYTATHWISENLHSLGGRPGPVVVAGDSAGGNLAAAVPMMSRDRCGPPVALQVLIYPITDCQFETPSYRDFATDYFLTRDAMIWFWEQYCPKPADREHPYVSPLKAQDLSELPPALVMTAEFDPLRDEAEAYANRLGDAGVDVTLSRYDGMIHGFTRRLNLLEQARSALDDVAAAIQSASLS